MRARGRGPGSGRVLGAILLGISSVLAPGPIAQNAPQPDNRPPPAAAPSGPAPVFTIPRATAPVRIDGVIDEDAWKSALSLELPYEIEPGENTPAPVKTEVLLIYDDEGLHAAFRAYDPDPAAIRAHLADQAANDDWVALFLDTFNDERRGFELFVNPFGVQMDASRNDVGNGGDQNEDMSWDAIWLSAGRLTPEGYEVEMSVPFTSLRFSRSNEGLTWGLFAMRKYPRNHRHQISLRPIDRNRDCFFCQEAKVAGFNGITPGRNLELDPTFTAHRGASREEIQGAPLETRPLAGEGGLSARWSITPNLTLNSALNPDFSQVEADTAQLAVNTRFALFFPEKRPFFMEAADFFTTPLSVVYTRTVLEPEWGVKVSGKEGPHALGAAFGRDEKTSLIFPSNQESAEAHLWRLGVPGREPRRPDDRQRHRPARSPVRPPCSPFCSRASPPRRSSSTASPTTSRSASSSSISARAATPRFRWAGSSATRWTTTTPGPGGSSASSPGSRSTWGGISGSSSITCSSG